MTLGRIRTDLSKSRIGDIAEQYVCIIAQWRGAEVFTNIGCTGKADMVFKFKDQLIEVDVKLAQWHADGKGNSYWKTPNASNVELPVYPVIVIPEGDILSWRIRWKGSGGGPNSPPHCPPGLEDFWSNSSTHV